MPFSENFIFLLFPLIFIGIWCVVLKINSCFGWSRLARHYSAFSRPEGISYHWQSMRMGRLANYNRCITFHVSKSGLRISVFPLFSFGHPPLFIPWSQIRFRKEEGGLFGKTYFYDLGTPRGGRMGVGKKMHQIMMHEMQSA